MRRLIVVCLVIVAAASCALAKGEIGSRRIVVSAAGHDYAETPVSAVLTPPGGFKSVVLHGPNGVVIPCQYQEIGDKKIKLMWIADPLEKGTSRTYRAEFSTIRSDVFVAGRSVQVERKGNTVDVSIDGAPFTKLNFADGPKPYFYPIIGPTGVRVTRNYPMMQVDGEAKDHPHQRSWWFTHGSVNGIDFWSESDKAGRIFQTRIEALESGPVMGRIRTQNDWVAPGGKTVCTDTREVRIYRISSGRLMDFDVTIHAPTEPVTFGDTKEGMMGFRVATSMDVDRGSGHIVNSLGQKDGDTWGRPAEWVDYYGPVNGKTVGITVMDHPASFRHPTYWHVRTYGLFAANPFGISDFPGGDGKDGSYTIPKGGELRFRYRVFIHEGDTERAAINGTFDAYAYPPVVTVD